MGIGKYSDKLTGNALRKALSSPMETTGDYAEPLFRVFDISDNPQSTTSQFVSKVLS